MGLLVDGDLSRKTLLRPTFVMLYSWFMPDLDLAKCLISVVSNERIDQPANDMIPTAPLVSEAFREIMFLLSLLCSDHMSCEQSLAAGREAHVHFEILWHCAGRSLGLTSKPETKSVARRS